MFNIILIFIMQLVSTCLSTLKSSFISREVFKPVYIITFVDALIFMYAVRLTVIADSLLYSILFTLAYAGGRTLGVYIANILDEKMGFGLIEVTIYKHFDDKSIALADRLRELGYSVTTAIGYGIEGKERLLIVVLITRKSLDYLKKIVEPYGNVNMSVIPVSKVTGKLERVEEM